MTLDDIIAQSDELLHNGLENSPTDALRLVYLLARLLKAEQYRSAAREAASDTGPRLT
jgi:hypothetical protein